MSLCRESRLSKYNLHDSYSTVLMPSVHYVTIAHLYHMNAPMSMISFSQ